MKHKSEFLFAIHRRLSSERMMLAYTLAFTYGTQGDVGSASIITNNWILTGVLEHFTDVLSFPSYTPTDAIFKNSFFRETEYEIFYKEFQALKLTWVYFSHALPGFTKHCVHVRAFPRAAVLCLLLSSHPLC